MISTIRTAAVSGLLGFVLAISTQLLAQSRGASMKASPQMEPGAQLIHQNMMDMAKEIESMKMPMEHNTDKMFALSMAMHHDDGVKMAQIELKHGKNAALKVMAKNIINTQSAEIKKLKKIAQSIR